MQARFIGFGEIEIDGQRFTDDLVIIHGTIHKRDKGPSKPKKDRFGHTPLSAKEAIPWDCRKLIIGTGAYGKLPVMKKVYKAAEKKGVELVVVPTENACELLSGADPATTNATLHITC